MEPVYSGKVREIYDISDEHLVIVTTDRISAFDHILPVPVKGKGIMLNKISNFWFKKTQNIVPNHMIDDRVEHMPSFFQNDGFRERTVMVQKLKMLPFEFVVRGYLFGSMWDAYKNGESFCGIALSGHYEQAQKLEQPVLTPARKHDVGHDEYVGMREVEAELGTELTERIVKCCLKLYEVCSEFARSKGLIIADAKFEFGLNNEGRLVLADELFTPDSSRYWDAAGCRPGTVPESFDKQFLRNWLLQHKTGGEFQFDKVPEKVLLQTGKLYRECLSRLTGADRE